MNDSTLLGQPLMNALPGKNLDITFLKGENVPYTSYRRRWASSLPQASSARMVRIFAALGTVTAAIYLVFTCATLITKPIWSWKLGRGMASRNGLGVEQDGDGDSSDVCSPGQTSHSWPLQPHPHGGMLSHRKAEEVNSAQPVESSASEQTETAHSEENTVADRLGALGEGLHQRKRKQGTSAGMADEGDASREKNPLLDTNVDGRRARSGRQLGSHAGPPSEEDQINLWLSSTAEDPSVEKPFAEGLHTPLASSMSLSSADNGEPAGGVKSRAAHAITLIHSPYDFNLESLLEEGDNIEWGTWFPEPITDTRPVSHFTANVDLSDCEEFKTYQKAEDEPTAPSAGAGPWESPPQDSGLTEMGAGPSSAMNQSEAKPPMKGEESAVRAAPETNIHTNMDIEAHPFVRFPSVPVGISERQFDMSKAQVFAGIRRNPVFSLSICRQIFLKSSLDKTDFHILLATVERLAFYALKTMDVSLCLYSRRSLGKVGTVFLVVDALYCAIQVLGENAKSELWWPQFMDRIKIAVRSYRKTRTGYVGSPREKKLARDLVSAIETYTRGGRPPAQKVLYLKRSLLCNPGGSKFSSAAWEPWRRDDAMWNEGRIR